MSKGTLFPGREGTPVTLAECREAVKREIREPQYLRFLLDWAVNEIEKRSVVDVVPSLTGD